MVHPKWVPQRDAAFALSTSERTLARMRADGVLPVGHCWRRKIPNNRNSHCLYDIEACIDVLNGQARAAELEQDLLAHSRDKEVSDE